MQSTHSHNRRRRNGQRERLPEFAKNLNASQRGLLTKFTKTGQVDPRNRVTEERPKRIAAREARITKEKQEARA